MQRICTIVTNNETVLGAYCLPDPNTTSHFISVSFQASYKFFKQELNAFSNVMEKLVSIVVLGCFAFENATTKEVSDFLVAWPAFIGWYDTQVSPFFFFPFCNTNGSCNVLCKKKNIKKLIHECKSAVLSLILSFGYGRGLKYYASTIIWLSIGVVVVGIFLVSFFLIANSKYAYTFGYTTIGNGMYYGGIVLAVLDSMYLLAVLFMFNRIQLAIALMKETSRVLNDVWRMFFYPIVPFMFICGYSAYWIVGTPKKKKSVSNVHFFLGSIITCAFGGGEKGFVYLTSVTEKYQTSFPEGAKVSYYKGGPTLYKSLQLSSDDKITHLQLQGVYKTIAGFHVFLLLWVMYFISYHTYTVICSIYAEWYFADWVDEPANKAPERRKKRGGGENELSHHPVTSSFFRVTRFHLGTVAFASLLIAIVEYTELTLNYFEKKLLSGEPSALQKCLLAIIHCVLRYLKCILDRINKNGLVITSIYGWPLCAASWHGIMLMFRNVVRAAALDMVSGYLEKIGQYTIVSLSCGITCAVVYYQYSHKISSLTIYLLV
ncbi:solute carrier family 44 protein member 2 [Reticulomyxa filosa]|uniref:Choline transporter-like protein n=1 Tax=Reticulomyxa filosa TaxID=46433 RepID=X6NC24_RETFI|nr:solute carrier family 44 protein member 2 [Reticulomyxa filosa]|eukprot:ETO23840.1 solute carrier family 44 protein member 2 [Reticulomyxa filosa]